MASTNPWRRHMPNDHEMADLPLPEITEVNPALHHARMQEMLNRPATPPPFPEVLPARPLARRLPWWIILLICLATLIVLGLLAAVIVLAMQYSGARATTTVLTSSLSAQSAELASMSASPSYTTYTQHHTTTNTTTTTATFTQFPTATISSLPTATRCDPANPGPLFLANNACVLINSCNSTNGAAHDTSQECVDFCALNPECAKQWDDADTKTLNLVPQLVGCCGYCGCFKVKGTRDVKMWPVKPTSTGMGA
jgi:type II secretory pathway pseudopilin PulG